MGFADIFKNLTLPAVQQTYTDCTRPRTKTVYARVPAADFEKRGVEMFALEHVARTLPQVGVYLGGGFVAATVMRMFGSGIETVPAKHHVVSDVDVFVQSEGVCTMVGNRLLAEGYVIDDKAEMCLSEVSDKLEPSVLTFRRGAREWPIQLIRIAYYESAEHLADSFDFTVCQFVYDVGTREFVFNPMAPLDYEAHRLVVHQEESAFRRAGRLAKYERKGFKACDRRLVGLPKVPPGATPEYPSRKP